VVTQPQSRATPQPQSRATRQVHRTLSQPVQAAAAYPTTAAVAADPGITVEPFDLGPLAFEGGEIDAEQAAPFEADLPPADEPYIPPPAEAPPSRIPRVEDFPPVAQRQMEARRGEGSLDDDRGPLSLLRRLASVGLGRREEEIPVASQVPQQPRPQAQPQPRPQPRVQPAPVQAQRVEPRVQPRAAVQLPPQQRSSVSPRQGHAQDPLYRPAQGDLDPHGRALPRDARLQDDELEIPAFLRRQAN
jgi:cell division protein FtsZ